MNSQAMFRAYNGLAYKEVSRVLRIWGQTLLPSAITITLYFLIFGRIVGSRVGEMGGVPYILFITPGLIMMAVITNSYSNVISSFFGAKFNRSIEELLVSPMPAPLVILGYLSGGLFRGFANGIIVSIVAALLSGLVIQHIVLTLLVFMLCSALFSLAGLLNGIYANKFDDIAIVTTFILTPLIYLGGVFYNISALPPIWRYISYCNPIHYFIDLFRYAMLDVTASTPWYVSFSLILIVTGVLYYACHYCLLKGKRMRS